LDLTPLAKDLVQETRRLHKQKKGGTTTIPASAEIDIKAS